MKEEVIFLGLYVDANVWWKTHSVLFKNTVQHALMWGQSHYSGNYKNQNQFTLLIFIWSYDKESGNVLTKINTHQQNTSYQKQYHSDNNSPLGKYSGNSVLFHMLADTHSIITCFGESVQILTRHRHKLHVP